MGVEGAKVESPCKQIKLDSENLAPNKDVAETLVITDMSNYTITKLLGQSDDGRTVFTLGEIVDKPGSAVVLFECNSIDFDRVKLFLSPKSGLTLKMHNDIYNIFQVDPPAGTNCIKTTIIYPATQKIINKFTQKPSYFVTETKGIYETVTKPYIMEHLGDHKWVYNILEGKAELDRVLVSDDDEKLGFKLVADLKWDMTTVENMYCLAMVQRRDLHSVRDLDETHLPMLRQMHEKCLVAIKEKFNIPRSMIRVYFHYQPAYYHLHVHFAHIRYGVGAPVIGKSLAMNDVIQNLEMCGDYYKKATLLYYIKDGHALSDALTKYGHVVRE